MIIFLIIGLVISLMIFIFFLATDAKLLTRIIISLCVGFAISGMICLQAKANEKTWNEGYCECGGQWEIVSVTRSYRGSERFYYSCDECRKVIETTANMGAN